MIDFKEKKPIKRSKLRQLIGKRYYIIKKYAYWYLTSKKYVKALEEKPLQHVVFSHSTPLLRKLKDVDMYLQYNKITNLRLAVRKLNGAILKPGEILSYWRLIGKPTYKKGYMDGVVLCPDGSFKPGVGGGLCQLSNLIYWMTLHTPLTVIERYRHSHDVFPDVNRTQPFGSGATCSYNYLDLQVLNNTNVEYQLIVYLTKDNLVGEWRSTEPNKYSYEIYEKEHSITAGVFGGYLRNNIIHRRIFSMNKELIEDEYVTENHAYMTYAPYLSNGKGSKLEEDSCENSRASDHINDCKRDYISDNENGSEIASEISNVKE